MTVLGFRIGGWDKYFEVPKTIGEIDENNSY